MKADLHAFLKDLDQNYLDHFPNIWEHITELSLATDEFLPKNLGDIFFVSSGCIGKYAAGKSERYITPGEFVLIPIVIHSFSFKALTNTTVYHLKRKSLYTMISQSPTSILLIDKINALHSYQMSFRYRLLKLPKIDRLEFFREHYPEVIRLISRRELADHLDISTEYLRNLF